MTWNELKQSGSAHYRGGEVQPIDLYKSGNMLWDFAVASIIKYAYRNRQQERFKASEINPRDLDKIEHYCKMLRCLHDEATAEMGIADEHPDMS